MPGEFNIPDNYNVLQISEIHAFEVQDSEDREQYCREVGRQVNDYVEEYNVDEVHIMGDTGTFDDVYNLLESIDEGPEVVLVAGDEDKKNSHEDEFTGFHTQISSQRPFDVGIDYQIFDEGFEKEISGNTLQAAHHPSNTKRDNSLNFPDTRENKVLENLFSVKRYTNENTVDSVPSLQDTDIVIYDHVHMPYPRLVDDTAVIGLGGRRFNYQSKADSIPERSIHMTSFGDDKIHTLHFDAEWDEIFEHQIFDQSGEEVEMFDVQTPRGHTNNSGYIPIQSRFRRDQIIREAWETEEDLPELWSNRET